MDEITAAVSKPLSMEEQVFNDILQEVKAKEEYWLNDPEKADLADSVMMLVSFLEISIMDKNPAGAAINAFLLASRISQIEGPGALKKMEQRHDAMSIEIERALAEIESENRKVTPSLVWQKIVERCGQAGSYCAEWKHETDKDKQEPVIVWFGVQGNQERLTYAALKERLRRRKTTLRTR